MNGSYVVFGFVVMLVITLWALIRIFKRTNPPTGTWKIKVLSLDDASQPWHDDPSTLHQSCGVATGPKIDENPPVFDHPEIAEFYEDVRKRYLFAGRGQRLIVVQRILELLDRFGDCPSVVINQKYSYGEQLPDRYEQLAKVPLWQHSISVARNMLTKTLHDISAPDYIIIGLAHDIGKIREFHGHRYCTGDHPFLSAVFLSGVPEFSVLTNHSDILKAIEHHHYIAQNDFLTKLLQECDKSVRDTEYGRQSLTVLQESKLNDEMRKFSPNPDSSKENIIQLKEEKELLALLGMALPNRNIKGYKPRHIDISTWFNGSATLCAIRESINIVSAGRWIAVSMPNGLVFCGCTGLWKILNHVSPHTPALFAAYANPEAKSNILHSIVWKLAEEFDAIAIELIKPDQYMCPVIITSSTGKIIKTKELPTCLIPFRAQALNVNSQELEREKSLTIRRMANVITPLDIPQKKEN